MLQQQARRAAEIVQNLMYFSRPPAPGKSRINLNELVERTLNLHAYSLRKNNITVDFLPETIVARMSLGDPHQLMQVFLNLILNAEQAIREVRDKGTLRIRLGKSGQRSLRSAFTTTARAFRRRSCPTSSIRSIRRSGRDAGPGLGLSICKAMMREHSGNVEAATPARGGRGVYRDAADGEA